jgi:soluble lytic murein transglycosylase-like protein
MGYYIGMDAVSIILSTAKTVGVSGSLLLAICSHESQRFKMNYNPADKGSPSYGYCQIKKETAFMLGFKGKANELNNPRTNAYWAARYLKYQQKNYGNDWVKLVSSYNAGSFNPSNKVVGCPRNLKYLKLVQKELPEHLKGKLDCGEDQLAETN